MKRAEKSVAANETIINSLNMLFRASILLVVLMAAFVTLTTGQVRAEPQNFNIPAQSVEQALKDFARQAGVELMFAGDDVARLQSRPVSGLATREEALADLLKGTGLVFAFEEEDLLVVRLPEATVAPIRTNRRTSDDNTLLAQANQAQSNNGGTGAADEEDDEDFAEEGEKVDQIIITGSLIRGTEASIGSKLVTMTRQDIERGGFGTVAEAIQSLTNNFTGGVNEFTRSAENDANISGGTSINLRGLGAGSTLTLVNGRRLAAGGLRGSFVDMSSIPVSLIDRIEVLADGASATYGADAVAGVLNIILRDDFEGAETGLRFGTVTEGGTQEYRASQIFGAVWDTGHALISYEYYKRESLKNEARAFAADSDLTSFGGDNFRITNSVPGNILDPATFFQTVAFAIPDGQDGTNLTPQGLLPGQVNQFNQNQGRDLLNDQERHSVFLVASQELGERLELFAEGRFSDRNFKRRNPGNPLTLIVPSSNPFFVDPFGGSSSIRVRYNSLADFDDLVAAGDTKTYNGMVGVKTILWGDWQLKTFGSYNSERRASVGESINVPALNIALANPDPATTFNPFGDGSFQQNSDTINSAILSILRNGQSDIWTGNLVVDGSLLQLPGGAVKLAVGANYDNYSLNSFTDSGAAGISESSFDREVAALFGEILVPLFDQDNSRTGLQRLIFTASVRYEDYDDVGDTTNPKFGLLWAPIEGFNIRGTYGTSFRAPDLVQLDISSNLNASFNFLLFDPLSPTGTTLALLLQGNNADLENETADTWTVGFDYTSSVLPRLEFDLTYYNITFENRITSANSAGLSILSQENRFASAITRNPTQAQIEEACNSGGTFFDFNGPCLTSSVGAIADLRLINAAITKTDGLDFNARYGFETENLGRFDFHFGGTYILNFDEAFGPAAPIAKLVNTVGNPIGLRLRNSVSWTDQKGLSATAFWNFSDSYIDNISAPERKVESWTTIDLTLAYRTGDRLANVGMNDTTFSFSVRNLFDADPPFVNNFNGIGFDPENASPLGRFISFNITKKW